MKRLKVFLEVVEIKTKVASLFPFLIGLLFSVSYFKSVNWRNSVLFFTGMIIFDMATTAINNTMDYKKAKSDLYRQTQNVIGRENVPESAVTNMIFAMLGITLLIGLLLSWLTGWLMLIMGAIVCFIGIFYTFGPVPLSRMPLGEIFSGFTMGLGIFAITVYINTVNNPVFYLDIDFVRGIFYLSGKLYGILAILMAAMPLVLTISNIMLANNLRDLEMDIKNHRYTLVYFIGREHGILLFQSLMYAAYVFILVGLLLGIFQWPILWIFVSFPKVRKNTTEFRKKVPLPSSFGYAIKNMACFNLNYAIALVLSILWQMV